MNKKIFTVDNPYIYYFKILLVEFTVKIMSLKILLIIICLHPFN